MTSAKNWKRVYDALNLQKSIDDFRKVLHDIGQKTKAHHVKTVVHEELTIIHGAPAFMDVEGGDGKKPTITVGEYEQALKQLFDEFSEASKNPAALIRVSDKYVDTLKMWKKILEEETIDHKDKVSSHKDALKKGLSTLDSLYDLWKNREIPLVKRDCILIAKYLREIYHPRDSADEKRVGAFIRFFEGIPFEIDKWLEDMEKKKGPIIQILSAAERFENQLRGTDVVKCDKERQRMAKAVHDLFVELGRYDRLREEVLRAITKLV